MNIQYLKSLYWPIKFYFISWLVILYELYKKEARAMGKSFLANIPHLCKCEKSGLELGLAQAAGPLGNLAARQPDRQRASLSGKGEREGISREILEAAGTSGEKVVSWSYQAWFY
jgi:hypothetical protein